MKTILYYLQLFILIITVWISGFAGWDSNPGPKDILDMNNVQILMESLDLNKDNTISPQEIDAHRAKIAAKDRSDDFEAIESVLKQHNIIPIEENLDTVDEVVSVLENQKGLSEEVLQALNDVVEQKETLADKVAYLNLDEPLSEEDFSKLLLQEGFLSEREGDIIDEPIDIQGLVSKLQETKKPEQQPQKNEQTTCELIVSDEEARNILGSEIVSRPITIPGSAYLLSCTAYYTEIREPAYYWTFDIWRKEYKEYGMKTLGGLKKDYEEALKYGILPENINAGPSNIGTRGFFIKQSNGGGKILFIDSSNTYFVEVEADSEAISNFGFDNFINFARLIDQNLRKIEGTTKTADTETEKEQLFHDVGGNVKIAEVGAVSSENFEQLRQELQEDLKLLGPACQNLKNMSAVLLNKEDYDEAIEEIAGESHARERRELANKGYKQALQYGASDLGTWGLTSFKSPLVDAVIICADCQAYYPHIKPKYEMKPLFEIKPLDDKVSYSETYGITDPEEEVKASRRETTIHELLHACIKDKIGSAAGNPESIKIYLTARNIRRLGGGNAFVSEYAATKAAEMLAESGAAYVISGGKFRPSEEGIYGAEFYDRSINWLKKHGFVNDLTPVY